MLIDSSVDNLPDGAQPRDLERFKKTYLDSAFICRYRECPRYSDGFTSATDRDAHESRHAKPLRCPDPSCEFFARGFTSKTGLLKHNRKYHPSPEEAALPEFEPRKPPEPQFVPPSPPPPPPPPRDPTLPPARVEAPPPESPETPHEEIRQSMPKAGRVSRAKKGLRVHKCDICGKVQSPIFLAKAVLTIIRPILATRV